MDYLTTLPNEVLHHILKDVEILDCYRLSLSCKALRNFIRDNKTLFKGLFLDKFDAPPEGHEDWEEQLHKLAKLEKIMKYVSLDEKLPHISSVADIIGHYIKIASRTYPSRTFNTLAPYFTTDLAREHNSINREAFLCQSTIFDRARIPKRSPETAETKTLATRQASAKLHCLWGVPITMPKRTRFASLYPYACSVVYDMRNYTDENFWGPFKEDGRATVDWERMEAVMIILGYNMKNYTESMHGIYPPLWRDPFRGASPGSFEPLSVTKREAPLGPCNEEDPYNVTGTWHRVVCFLDFHELHHYNFSSPDPGPGTPRPPIDTTEAIRMISMEISFSSAKHAGEEGGPGPNDDPNWPVVYFTGKSRSMHASWDSNANSNIRGKVSVTHEGEVRWTTWSIYWGEERWKSEGIQIGGINSGRGVFGHWFDKNLSDEGPAGPTAFWKISNEIHERRLDGESDEEDDLHDPDFMTDDEGDDDDAENTHWLQHLHHHAGHIVIISTQGELQD